MIKISVIVPVYNTEKFLKKCIETIVNQSLKEIEIIIINDCSPDNSLEIIREYKRKDERIILIDKKKNEGLTAARNSGLEISRGEYIMHIDSDDWIEQNYLKDMYETATKYNADMVISDFYCDYGNNKIIYQVDQCDSNTGSEINSGKAIENLGEGGGFPAIWNKLTKRSIYIKNNIKFPYGIFIGEDLGTTIFLLYYSKKIIKVKKAYLHYVQNANSLTYKYNYSALTDIYYVLNKIEEFFKNTNYISCVKTLKAMQLLSWLFKVECKYNDEEYMKILSECLLLLEERRNIKSKSKILKCYFSFRKIFTSTLSFKITRILYRLRLKMIKKIHKI